MKNLIYVLILIALSSIAFAAQFDVQIAANATSGSVPFTVKFTATPSDQIQSYAWDFNDDGNVDSTAASVSYTYTVPGNYLVTLNAASNDGENATATQLIVAKSKISVSLTANPASGVAPLKVQFTAAATGQGNLNYDWDFNNDGTIDSTAQNPETTYAKEGTYVAKLTVIDETGNSESKNTTITVTKFDSGLKLDSYFPKTLNLGENEVTFIVQNSGSQELNDLDGRIVGNGITSLTSSRISTLNPGDKDSVTIKVRILQAGTLSGTAKILDKSFPISFTVSQGAEYNKTALQADISALRTTAQQYEAELLKKKADKYIVDTAEDNIKSAKSYLQKAQESLLTNDLKNTKLNIDLASSNLEDARLSLLAAQKQTTTLLQFLRENALAITAIIAALGAVSGILMKLFGHAKKFGERVSTVVKTHKMDFVKKKKGAKGKKKEKPSKKNSKKEEPKHVVPEENKQE